MTADDEKFDALIAEIRRSLPGGQIPAEVPPPPPAVPAGWYPDPDNTAGPRYGSIPGLRYFDGVEWTEHRAPMQRSQQRQPYPAPPIYVQQNVVAPPVVVNNGASGLAGLHLLLTFLTCGLWLPVWLLIEILQAAGDR